MKTPNARYVTVLSAALVLLFSVSPAQMRSGKFGVGAGGSLYLFNPNLKDNLLKGGGGVALSYSAVENLGIRAMFGTGQLGWKDNAGYSYSTNILSGNLYVSYDMIPHGTVNPFLFVGTGLVYFDPRSDLGTYVGANIQKFDINYLGGIGVDFFFNEFVSLTVSGEFAMTNTNKLDMQKSGTANESYSRINLELRYYFFDQNYVTKLIQALQERYRRK